MDRGAWRPTVYRGLKKSDTTEWLSMHAWSLPMSFSLISQNLCRASTYLPFWDVVVGKKGFDVIERFLRSAEGLWWECRLKHKTYVLTGEKQWTNQGNPLALGTLYSTFALPCCSPRLILGKLSLQLGSFFPSLTALRSVASSPTSTLVSGMVSRKNVGMPWGLWTSLVAQMVKNLCFPFPGNLDNWAGFTGSQRGNLQ